MTRYFLLISRHFQLGSVDTKKLKEFSARLPGGLAQLHIPPVSILILWAENVSPISRSASQSNGVLASWFRQNAF